MITDSIFMNKEKINNNKRVLESSQFSETVSIYTHSHFPADSKAFSTPS